MKLSLKMQYACQVLGQLGYSYGSPDLPHIEELAKAEAVPSNYLVQILNELRTAGLITSRRGKQGGYALARAPEEISLYEVMTAVEGEILAHSQGGKGASAARAEGVWQELARRVEALLRDYSVKDFMAQAAGEMWYI
ncbi:MAG: Rrf2 family transcriptional regulator [Verrucomicrobia bacterium]|jgi:Rrf2 family protein|nr:Rrf2 family transcriptional regulator [Verrucomicrobiota bacterium]